MGAADNVHYNVDMEWVEGVRASSPHARTRPIARDRTHLRAHTCAFEPSRPQLLGAPDSTAVPPRLPLSVPPLALPPSAQDHLDGVPRMQQAAPSLDIAVLPVFPSLADVFRDGSPRIQTRAIELLELAKRACKRLRLNDATAELDEDGLKICEAAWYATRARRGALACQMNVVYVLATRGGRLLGWLKFLLTDHEHFLEELVVAESEQGTRTYLGYAMIEAYMDKITGLGWPLLNIRLQCLNVGAEAAMHMYTERLECTQWTRPKGSHTVRGRRRQVPWTKEDDPGEGCVMLQAKFPEFHAGAKLAAERGATARAAQHVTLSVCLGLGNILEEHEEQEEEEPAVPMHAPTPAPMPAPMPAPTPAPTPAPMPAATPAATPTPAPMPAPMPALLLAQMPAPTPAPLPAATPAPMPAPAPTPAPTRTPAGRKKTTKRSLELPEIFEELGLVDKWERFQYTIDDRTCSGMRPVLTIPGPQPEGFVSKTQNVRLTWQRLQVSKEYAKRTCDSDKSSLSSILVDVLDRRLIPASDVDSLVSNLVVHIKRQEKEIARLSLLRQSCDDDDDDAEGALMTVDCY